MLLYFFQCHILHYYNFFASFFIRARTVSMPRLELWFASIALLTGHSIRVFNEDQLLDVVSFLQELEAL